MARRTSAEEVSSEQETDGMYSHPLDCLLVSGEVANATVVKSVTTIGCNIWVE